MAAMGWLLSSNIFNRGKMKTTLMIFLTLYIGCHLHDSRNSETIEEIIRWEEQSKNSANPI